MAKFTELEKGTLTKEGKEYDYAIEIADDFPKTQGNNIRIKILQQRPAIKKVRTRYDPDIFMQGDKDASMQILLGYDVKALKSARRQFLSLLLVPLLLAGNVLLLANIKRVPVISIPYWLTWSIIALGAAIVLGLTFKLIKSYALFVMESFAEYLKAKDLKRILEKEGFKVDR